MKLILNLLRGFRGHPSHPPMTDASIGAYTAGTAMIVAGSLGFLEEKMAWGGFLAIAVGLLLGIPTVITGVVDYVRIPRGTGMRRTANLHWVIMASATASFLVADSILQTGFDTGRIPGWGTIMALVGFTFLFAGGWIGGTIVFVYGMRVLDEPPTHPTLEALKPKYPPD